jgi:hypothetical protein
MNIRGMAAAVAVSLCLVGCAPTIYDKPGATQQDFVTDKYACNKDAHQSGGFGTGLAGAIAINQFFDECMNAHGWYARPK